MFGYLYEWLENLAGYTILTVMVTQILPNDDYRKYIRFFCGMILIVMLVTPLFQVFGIKDDYEKIYQDLEYQNMVNELEEAAKMAIVEGESELE